MKTWILVIFLSALVGCATRQVVPSPTVKEIPLPPVPGGLELPRTRMMALAPMAAVSGPPAPAAVVVPVVPVRRSPTGLSFVFTNPPNATLTLSSSTNLMNWEPITSVGEEGVVEVHDYTHWDSSVMFYRAVIATLPTQ